MTIKLNQLLLGVAASVALMAAIPAANAGDLYVTDSQGEVVKNAFGECVESIGGTANVCEKKAEPPKAPAAKDEPAKPIKMTLAADANFDFNKSNLKPAGKAKLDDLVSQLKSAKSYGDIIVIGHTDSVGSDAYNQKLSERRAKSVKDYLVSKGIPAADIRTSGRGEKEPVASNATAEGRAQNRRVEITVETTKSPAAAAKPAPAKPAKKPAKPAKAAPKK